MCVIIYKPKGLLIPESDLRSAWNQNSDGAGIILPDRCPKVLKGMMKLKDLLTAIDAIGEKEAVIHLRFATHGSISKENTHPFRCGNDRHLMHNGMLSNYGKSGKDGCSDSAHLAQDISSMSTYGVRRLLDSIHGKFAFVNREKVTLHGDFVDREGIKYSNLHWVPTYDWTNYRKGRHLPDSDSSPYLDSSGPSSIRYTNVGTRPVVYNYAWLNAEEAEEMRQLEAEGKELDGEFSRKTDGSLIQYNDKTLFKTQPKSKSSVNDLLGTSSVEDDTPPDECVIPILSREEVLDLELEILEREIEALDELEKEERELDPLAD